jgi:short-subunit dehydrogenase
MWPWAAVYAAQLAIASLVWSIVYRGGVRGWLFGVVSAAFCSGVAMALWRARDRFGKRAVPLTERYGKWALVTGASAGIGAEFARALAREGLSCVLTARREDRLSGLAMELEQKFHVHTRVVPVDLALADGPDRLIAAVDDLEIAFLVNNAGYGHAGRFAKQDGERLRNMVQLNCVTPVVLTSRLLAGMQARGRGAVVITGSIAGAQPVPFNGVYAATKVFDRYFGEALWAEQFGTGIDVLVLEPGPTETEFQSVAGETAHPGEHPAAVVATALEALGRQPSVISGWLNWLRANTTRLAPRSLLTLGAGQVMARWTPPEMR